MLLAGYMNRTLVVPYRRSEVPGLYNPRLLLPLQPLRLCFGPSSLLTTAELRQQQGGQLLQVDAVVCTRGTAPCVNDPRHSRKGQWPHSRDVTYPPGLRLRMLGHPDGLSVPVQQLVAEIEAAAAGGGGAARMLVLNDVQSELVSTPNSRTDLPFARLEGCPNALAPPLHPEVVAAAHRFVEERGAHLGGWGRPWVAVHWRRGDLMKLCSSELCRLRPEQAASCTAQAMLRQGSHSLFLASDGTAAEKAEFLDALRKKVPQLQVLERPPAPEWTQAAWAAALWGEAGFGEEDWDLLGVGLDKAICSLADVFLGTTSSSFSADILSKRRGMRRRSCADDFLCSFMRSK